MNINKFHTLILSSVLLLVGCGVTQDAEVAPEVVENVSESEKAVGALRNSLETLMERRADTIPYFPYFAEAPTLSVVADIEFRNLEVSIDASLYDEGTRDGSTLAIPLQEGSSSMVDTSRAVNACAKDAVQDFTKWIVFFLQEQKSYPQDSLKIQMRFVTTVGKTTTDKYGNTDSSNIKEKTLATTLMHISRVNLNKIDNAFSPPDYFALSDVTTPKKYPTSWNKCTKYDL